MWAAAARGHINTAQQSGTQVVESFHQVLKLVGLRELEVRARRLDWLLDRLMGELLPRFKRRVYAQQDGLVCNTRREREAYQALQAAASIPDTSVQFSAGGEMRVLSSSLPGVSYTVSGLPTQPRCTCPVGQKDRLCKHAMKALQRQELMNDAELLTMYGSLWGTAAGQQQLEQRAAAVRGGAQLLVQMVAGAAGEPEEESEEEGEEEQGEEAGSSSAGSGGVMHTQQVVGPISQWLPSSCQKAHGSPRSIGDANGDPGHTYHPKHLVGLLLSLFLTFTLVEYTKES